MQIPEKTTENKITDKSNKRAGGITSFLKVVLALFIFLLAICALVVGINMLVNRSVKETFYQIGCSKVENSIRIVQISDLHNSVVADGNDSIVNRVRKLDPDIIALTGDIVDQRDADDNAALDLCADLAAIAPTYYVYGNDETIKEYGMLMTGKELDAICSETPYDPSTGFAFTESRRGLQNALEQRGVKVLLNSMDTITIDSSTVDIYGVLTYNPATFWPYISDDFKQYAYQGQDNVKIMLCHAPYLFNYFADEELGDLILCGHTHGGLARLPILGAVYESVYGVFPERSGAYMYGKYELSGKTLIVNGGISNRDFMRINNQPEFVVVDINRY